VIEKKKTDKPDHAGILNTTLPPLLKTKIYQAIFLTVTSSLCNPWTATLTTSFVLRI